MKDWLLVVLAYLVILAWEWPGLAKAGRPERVAFAVTFGVALVATLAYLLTWPSPGPTQWVDRIFRPIGLWLVGGRL